MTLDHLRAVWPKSSNLRLQRNEGGGGKKVANLDMAIALELRAMLRSDHGGEACPPMPCHPFGCPDPKAVEAGGIPDGATR